MNTFDEKTTVATISELRTKCDEIFEHLKSNRVVLERHRKPVAVMVDYEKFAVMSKLLRYAEDYVLGSLALERDSTSTSEDFVDIDEW